jgi:hypothetical protein
VRRSLLIGLLVLVAAALLAVAGPAWAKGGGASAHPNRGNHCGQAHAKHAHKVGQSCQKQTRTGGSANSNGHQAGNPQAGGDDDQGGDNDDQGDDNDQGGPGGDDQGDDDGGDQD